MSRSPPSIPAAPPSEHLLAEMYGQTTGKLREGTPKMSSRLTFGRRSTERVEQEMKSEMGNKENEFTRPQQLNQLNQIKQEENQDMRNVNKKIQFIKSHHLSQLDHINLENVLNCLIERYNAGLFYTYAGPILLSMNPCLPTPSRKSITDTLQTKPTNGSPSVYSIGEKCLKTLAIMKMDSIVVVTGDSGAGKTTATEQLLTYFLSHGHQSKDGLDHKIKKSTSILEALGNAWTTSNPNSSRFGRFIELRYEKENIIGAEIRTCLLQKHRVPQKDCQNFHIFYYIAAGLSQEDAISQYLLNSMSKSNLSDIQNLLPVLMKKQAQALETQYLDELQSLLKSFDSLGMMEEFAEVIQIVTGIMLLLNTHFIPADCTKTGTAVQCDPEIMRIIEKLFSIPEDSLESELTSKTRRIERRCSIFKTEIKPDEIRSRVDSLATALYNSLFNYILDRINLKLNTSPLNNGHSDDSNEYAEEHTITTNCISLLDLYGFENLKKNHLEQLCINYANEKLQITTNQIVNKYMEELKFTNEVHANLIQLEKEGKERIHHIQTNIFSLLDDGNRLKASCDEVLYRNLVTCAANSRYIQTEKLINPALTCPFTIRHYATSVKYEMKEMVKQNTDKLPEEFYVLFAKSRSRFVQTLFREFGNIPNLDTPGRKRQDTICQSFKRQADHLISKLENTNHETYFIKCLRPNETLKRGDVNRATVKAQLVSAGIEDIITITSEGLPIRIPIEKFSIDFRATEKMHGSTSSGLLTKLSFSSMNAQCGKSKVFLSESAHTFLKDLEQYLRKRSAFIIKRALKKNVKNSKDRAQAEAAETAEIQAVQAELAKLKSVEPNALEVIPELEQELDLESMDWSASISTSVTHSTPKEPLFRNLQSPSFETVQLMRVLNLRYKESICSQPFWGPIRFHTRATVLPYSTKQPNIRPQGINEVFDVNY